MASAHLRDRRLRGPEHDEPRVARLLAQELRARGRAVVHAPEILVGGNVLVSETFASASESDLLRGEAIALPIAIAVMAFTLAGCTRQRPQV